MAFPPRKDNRQAPSPSLSSAGRRTPDSMGSGARFGYAQERPRPNVAAAKSKVGSLGRTTATTSRLGIGPKKKAKETMVDQDRRRTSVIHVGEDIGAELEAAPERKKSMSRSYKYEDEHDFDDFSEAEHDSGGGTQPKGSLSSDSGGWTPSFAGRSTPNTPLTADEEETRDARRLPRDRESRPPARPSAAAGKADTFLTDEEDSSPLASRSKVPPIPLPVPSKRSSEQRPDAKAEKTRPPARAATSQSFLSDSDSEVAQSPVARGPMPILMEEPVDLSTSPLWEQSGPQPASPAFQSAPVQRHEARYAPEVEEPRPLPRKNSREDSPKHVTLQPVPEVAIFASPEAVLPPPTPQFDSEPAKAASLPPSSASEASPMQDKALGSPSPASDGSCSRLEELASSPSEAAATTTASQGAASRSLASNGSPRSPYSEEAQDLSPLPLKRQLEELEEQQRLIQNGLAQALEYERRLRADEVDRCQSLTADLLEALETERRRHSEDIRAWELRLQTQLNESEAKWRAEVTALQAEVAQLRSTQRPAAEDSLPSAPPERAAQSKESFPEEVRETEGAASAPAEDDAGSTASTMSMCESLWKRPSMPMAPSEEAQQLSPELAPREPLCEEVPAKTSRLSQPSSTWSSTLEAPSNGAPSWQGREISFDVQEPGILREPTTMAEAEVPRLNLSLAAWQAREASPDHRSTSSAGPVRSFPVPVPVDTPKASAGRASASPASRYTDGSPQAQVAEGPSWLSSTPRTCLATHYPPLIPEPPREGYTFGRSVLMPAGSETGSSPRRLAAETRLLSPPRAEHLQPPTFFPTPATGLSGDSSVRVAPTINFSLGRPQVTFEMPRGPW